MKTLAKITTALAVTAMAALPQSCGGGNLDEGEMTIAEFVRQDAKKHGIDKPASRLNMKTTSEHTLYPAEFRQIIDSMAMISKKVIEDEETQADRKTLVKDLTDFERHFYTRFIRIYNWRKTDMKYARHRDTTHVYAYEILYSDRKNGKTFTARPIVIKRNGREVVIADGKEASKTWTDEMNRADEISRKYRFLEEMRGLHFEPFEQTLEEQSLETMLNELDGL